MPPTRDDGEVGLPVRPQRQPRTCIAGRRAGATTPERAGTPTLAACLGRMAMPLSGRVAIREAIFCDRRGVSASAGPVGLGV